MVEVCGFFEGAGETAVKVKAHASSEDVAQGKTAWWQKIGNDEADAWAKIGAGMHPLSDQDVLHHKALHTFTKSLGVFLAKSAAEFVDKGLVDMDPLDVQKGVADMQEKQGQAELVVDACVAKSFPPPPPCFKEGVYIFNGHHLVASRLVLPSGAVSSSGIMWCRRCGAYISAGPGERARPTALLEVCAGKRAGAGLATQRRRALGGKHPAHGAKDWLDQRLAEPSNLSPWQVLALEAWGKEAAIDKPHAGPQKVWKQELSRDKILQGFGLTEWSLEVLAARLVEENALAQEEPQRDERQFLDESDLEFT